MGCKDGVCGRAYWSLGAKLPAERVSSLEVFILAWKPDPGGIVGGAMGANYGGG